MRALLVLFALVLSFAPPADPPIDPAEALTEAAETPAEAGAPRPAADAATPGAGGLDLELRSFADDPIGVREVVLANGLTVLLSENHERPEVYGAVVVRTGGSNDPADHTGMAHYLEHMLFKGTTELGTSDWAAEAPLQARIIELYEDHAATTDPEQRARIQAEIAGVVEQTYAYAIPNELDQMLAELGGSGVNAFTSEDETVYHNRFPASQIDRWLEIYAHRFQDPVFRLFPTELEAVYEEKNIALDRFEVNVVEAVNHAAFPNHPYGTQTVIGEVEDLKSPSLVAMRAYFDTYYVANNMALVLAGDFDAEAVLAKIVETFGSWERGPEPEPRGGEVESFEGRELVSLRVTPVRVGAYGFRTVPPSHPDFAALSVARELLVNDQGSGFIDRLVDEGKILIALPYNRDLAAHGFDTLFFAPKILGQTFKKAEERVLDAFHRIGRGDFDEAEMLALRDGLRRSEDLQWEDNEERTMAIASAFIRHQDWQGYLDYRARLAEVTRDQVMRVGQTYYGDDYLALRSRMGFPAKPRLAKPNYPSVTPQPGVHSSFYEATMGQPSPAPKLRFVDFDADIATTPVAEGVTLLSVPNPFNDTYELQLRFGVGTDAIPELELAAAYLGRIGSAEIAAPALPGRLALIGTTLEFRTTNDEMVVDIRGPEAKLGEALAIVEGLMHGPVADTKRWKSLRRELKSLDKVSGRDVGYTADALREYVLHGDNSRYLRGYGRRGRAKLDARQLLAAWAAAQDYELIVRYTGNQEPRVVAERLRTSLELEGSTRKPAVEPVVYPRVLPARDTVFFLARRDAIQTRLGFIVDGDPVPADQRAAADAYAQYMGGSMGGLVFQEIREFRALAYSAWGTLRRDRTPEQAGYFEGAIGCQADKTFESIEVMRGLITDMPVKPERMPALISALVRAQETRSPSFRRVIALVEAWHRMGYVEDPRRARVAAYPELEFADIEAFHRAQVADRPVILTVVGDPRRVDRKELERFGEVVVVKPRQVLPR